MPDRPRLIPVIDVMHGQVVHAAGGVRSAYRPLTSKITTSTHPLIVARALIETTEAREIYVADLDAIEGRTQISAAVVELVQASPVPVWLDGGFGDGREVAGYDLPHLRPVVGFETCLPPQSWNRASTTSRPGFSIDMRDDQLIGDWRGWSLKNNFDAPGLARKAIELGCCRLIILDLSRVGSGKGCGTDDVLKAIRANHPHIELIAGGGVNDWQDIERLSACGVDAVLAATAIHQGRLTPGN